jgi:hypothetical protein
MCVTTPGPEEIPMKFVQMIEFKTGDLDAYNRRRSATSMFSATTTCRAL